MVSYRLPILTELAHLVRCRDPLEHTPPPQHGRRTLDRESCDPDARVDAERHESLSPQSPDGLSRDENQAECDPVDLPPEHARQRQERVADDRDEREEEVQRHRDRLGWRGGEEWVHELGWGVGEREREDERGRRVGRCQRLEP